ncbi:MAG: hypothetical protein L0Y58_26170 [Verrucomicrobia subdivision 3 bacterium]|nr:hypothetical protein [Limisphaerales bacterium]
MAAPEVIEIVLELVDLVERQRSAPTGLREALQANAPLVDVEHAPQVRQVGYKSLQTQIAPSPPALGHLSRLQANVDPAIVARLQQEFPGHELL